MAGPCHFRSTQRLLFSEDGYPAPARKPTRITVVARLPFTDVLSLISGPMGLYLLRRSPFPGDPSGAGYQVDLVDPSSGDILASAEGDACPQAFVNAFGSLWVLTSNCAMPGGLGVGVDRLDANTLDHEARITSPAGLAFAASIGATASTVWVLQTGSVYGPEGLMGIDPATNSVTRTKTFRSGELDVAMRTTMDRIVVGGELIQRGKSKHTIFIRWVRDSTLQVLSQIAVIRTFAALGPIHPRSSHGLHPLRTEWSLRGSRGGSQPLRPSLCHLPHQRAERFGRESRNRVGLHKPARDVLFCRPDRYRMV